MPGKTDVKTMDPRFLYIGTGVSGGNIAGDVLAVPFPSSGAFESSRAVNSARNINNVVVGQMIGRAVDKQNMSWTVMPCSYWWSINRWLESHGMFFYCKYFAHNVGKWRIRKFYCGDPKCEPYKIDAATGIPAFYRNCSINVIDVGDDETYTLSTATGSEAAT